MNTTEAADLARSVLDDSEGYPAGCLYTLTAREARTLALAALRAAFDAGRAHEREHVRPAEVTEEMRRAAASAYEDMAQVTRPENHEKCLNAALSAALAWARSKETPND